ncbi:response regulator transcription factor [Streptococcus iniae]
MLRMIIVEDEQLIRDWLAQVLDYEQLGIALLATARDGQEGLDLIRDCAPDIVLTDIMMPRMTAFDMFEASRDLAYDKIILSSYSDFEHAKKAMRYGVSNFLAKPLDVEELRDTLWQLSLDKKHQNNKLMSIQEEVAIPGIELPQIDHENWSALVIEYLHQNYNKAISTEEIARNFGYSESYLYKKIKEELGITLKDYLNHYRVKRAIQLMLSDSDSKVYEIALAVGFSDYNYFGKVFRRYTGLTFTEFRENFTHRG